MRFQDIKPGVELKEDLTPQKFSPELVVQISTPWVAGITTFYVTINLTLHLFHIWDYAPLFYVIGFLVSVLLSILSIIIGFVVLLFTGSFFVYRNIPELYSAEAFQAYTALIIAAYSMRFIKELLTRVHVSRDFGIAVLIISVFSFLYLSSMRSPSYFSVWIETMVSLIKSQFSQ